MSEMNYPGKHICLVLMLAAVCLPAAVCAEAPDTDPFAVPVILDPAGAQSSPVVVIDRSDRMLVFWRDSSNSGQRIMAQGFDRSGGRLGPVGAASPNTGAFMGAPAASVDFDGTAVVAWHEQSGGLQQIYLQRFRMTGQPVLGLPLPRPEINTIFGSSPAVAVDSAGNAILVWEVENQDVDIFGTWIAHNDSVGVANRDSARFAWIGSVPVTLGREGRQCAPAVAADRKGNFVVAWSDLKPDSTGIRARIFAVDGFALEEYLLPWPYGTAPDTVSAPGIAVAGAGYDKYTSRFLVSWVHADPDSGKVLVLAEISLYLSRGLAVSTAQENYWTIRDTLEAMPLSLERPGVSGSENGAVAVLWQRLGSNGTRLLYANGFNLQNVSGTEGSEVPLIQPALLTDTTLADSAAIIGDSLRNPALAVEQDGGFTVVWEKPDYTGADLLMQSYTAAGGRSVPLFIAPGVEDEVVDRSAAVVGHPDGGFSLFWEKGTGGEGTRIEKIKFKPDGRSLDEGEPLAGGYQVQSRPVAAVKRDCAYLVAWREKSATGSYRLRSLQFDREEKPLAGIVELEQSSSNYLSGLEAALGADGRCYLVWERWKPETSAPELILARFDSGTVSLAENAKKTVVSPSSGGGQLASVAVSPGGYHLVIWRQGASDGINASIRGRFYDPADRAKGPELRISEQRNGYLGGVGHSVAAASLLADDFLVVWQEFFGENQRLYYCCYYYDGAGDSLAVRGSGRDSLYTGGKGSIGKPAQSSPYVSVDTLGNYLVLWVEKEKGGPAFLRGRKLNLQAAPVGEIFKVPGVEMGCLPVVGGLGNDRFAIAWQDTVGVRMRTMAQVLKIDFHTVVGQVFLSVAAESSLPVWAHVEGNVNDSTAVDSRGFFSFRSLVAGSYRLWFSARGRLLPAGLEGFRVETGDPEQINLGAVAVSSVAGERLPRAGRFTLYQNVPNPFNPSTTISFDLEAGAGPLQVLLEVYDLRGRRVAEIFSGPLEGVSHSFVWDGTDSRGRPVSSGVYLYRLNAGTSSAVRKMVLIK
ncbi:MAG: T9SS type A sorting domain-containing protein [Candidatus Glassbacteria bacterium]|nr:T9SS type A sorting domain-containing protein [Candidatus Glassbacteria bacterium]